MDFRSLPPERKLDAIRSLSPDDVESIAREETDPLILPALFARARPAFVAEFLTSPRVEVKLAAVSALALAAAVEPLLSALEDDDVAVRAREAIQHASRERLDDALAARMSDPSRALGLMERLEYAPTDLLLDFLGTGHALRGRALASLALRGEFDRERTERLRTLARRAEGDLQLQMLDLLHRLEPPAPVESRESPDVALRRLGEAIGDDEVRRLRDERAAVEAKLRETESRKVEGGSIWKAAVGAAGQMKDVLGLRAEISRLSGRIDARLLAAGREALDAPGHAELAAAARAAVDAEAADRYERKRRSAERREAVKETFRKAGRAVVEAARRTRDYAAIAKAKIEIAALQSEFDRGLIALAEAALAAGGDFPEFKRLDDEMASAATAFGAIKHAATGLAARRRREALRVGRELFDRPSLEGDALVRRVSRLRLTRFKLGEKAVEVKALGENMAQDDLAALLQQRRSVDEEVNQIDRKILDQHGRFLAVIFTDMQDFTRRSAEGSIVEVMALLDLHDRLLIPPIEKHGGRVVKKIGDALMATFDDPLSAVLAAVDAQRALRDHNRGAPPDRQIRVRIGINAGRVILKENDVYGDPVNVASRVEGLARPEQILITQDVRDLIDEARLKLAALGPQKLKGKPEPVAVFEVQYA